MKKLNIFALVLAFLSIVACGKRTVESETTRWKAAQDRINRVKSQYPNFAAVLDEVFKAADADFKAAEGISDDEKKVAAMSAAIDKAAPSFVMDLDGLEQTIRELDDKISKSKQTGGDVNDRTAIMDASQRGDIAVAEARQLLKSAQPTDISSANATVKNIKDNIDAAKKRLDDLVSAAEKKINDAKKSEEDAKKAADQKAEEEKKAAADIKCTYCGVMNKAGSLKCSGCGASLEKK